MTGIAGTVGRGPVDAAALLQRLGEAMRVVAGSEVERWTDAHAALCRVRNPAVDAGRQPVASADGRRILLFYGECFGYETSGRDPRRQGEAFSPGDAEYVLGLHELHGDAAFAMLSGSFCCALYDAADHSLRLASDRLGSRPLFHGLTGDGRLVFATRVAPLLVDPGICAELDTEAVLEFCTLQRVLGDKTYHRGVRMLPPASLLHFRDGKSRILRYWTPQYAPQSGSLERHAEELAATMKAAMAEVERGPGAVGILLSGGLDGRMMVAAASRPLACYCFGDYQNPEFEVAREVAKARGFAIRFLRRDPDQYADMLDRAVDIGSGMHPFNHAHALGFVEQIAGHTPVLTHGYGVEALFRGTTLPKREHRCGGVSWQAGLDPTLTEASLPERFYRRAYSLLGRYPQLFAAGAADDIEARIEDSARRLIAEAAPHCANIYDRLLWSDVFARSRYTGYLFLLALRPYVIERSVLFDSRVIDLHLRIPVQLRADDRLWMRAMTLLDRRVARVPSANTGIAPGAPPWLAAGIRAAREAVRRVPVVGALAGRGDRNPPPGLSPISWPRFDWMIRNNARLRGLVADTLSDPQALPSRIFDRGQATRIFAEHLEGRGRHRDILFALLTFGRWHRRYAAHG